MCMLAPMPIYAVQVDGLYTATVAVDDQSTVVRQKAILVAIKQVVQKVSGRQSVLQNTALQSALSNVSSYVEQFQYKPMEDNASGYWLTVRFQKAALDRVLQQFDVPVWGANRPEVLVWLAVDNGRKKFIVGPDSSHAEELRQSALKAGLAITLPLLDLKDQRAVGFNDVWAGFSDQVLSGSVRYNAKQVVYGRLLRNGNKGWRLNWTLINADGQQAGFEDSVSLDSVLPKSLASIAEHLAGVYAPRGFSTLNTLVMQVDGVRDLNAFVKVTRYLASLDMVKALDWDHLIDNQAVLTLSISGNVGVLKDIIALNTILLPLQSPIIQYENEQPLVEPLQQRLYYRAN